MTKEKKRRVVTIHLRHGDALDRLREIPTGVVGAVIGDPPYD
jgi:hypothetical protein